MRESPLNWSTLRVLATAFPLRRNLAALRHFGLETDSLHKLKRLRLCRWHGQFSKLSCRFWFTWVFGQFCGYWQSGQFSFESEWYRNQFEILSGVDLWVFWGVEHLLLVITNVFEMNSLILLWQLPLNLVWKAHLKHPSSMLLLLKISKRYCGIHFFCARINFWWNNASGV